MDIQAGALQVVHLAHNNDMQRIEVAGGSHVWPPNVSYSSLLQYTPSQHYTQARHSIDDTFIVFPTRCTGVVVSANRTTRKHGIKYDDGEVVFYGLSMKLSDQPLVLLEIF